jgi:hypothetical protein
LKKEVPLRSSRRLKQSNEVEVNEKEEKKEGKFNPSLISFDGF